MIPDEDGDLADYMASLRRVQALRPQRIYPAHGAVIEDAAGKIQEYIDHRLERERQILETLGAGARTIPEMVKVIYAEVPEKLHVMAGKSVHSHLKKLLRTAASARRSSSPLLRAGLCSSVARGVGTWSVPSPAGVAAVAPHARRTGPVAEGAGAQPAPPPTLRESQPCGLRALAKGPLPLAAHRHPRRHPSDYRSWVRRRSRRQSRGAMTRR